MFAHPNRHAHESISETSAPSDMAEAFAFLEKENRARIQTALHTPASSSLAGNRSEMDDFTNDLGSFIRDLDQSMGTSGAQPHVSGEVFDPEQIQNVLQMEKEARERQHRKAA